MKKIIVFFLLLMAVTAGAQSNIYTPSTTGSPGSATIQVITGVVAPYGYTASTNTAGVITFTPGEVNLSAGATNVDLNAGCIFYRSTTNVAIAFQITNCADGKFFQIRLTSVGGTATPAVTVNCMPGYTMSAANQTTGTTNTTYTLPIAGRTLIMYGSIANGDVDITFSDNH